MKYTYDKTKIIGLSQSFVSKKIENEFYMLKYSLYSNISNLFTCKILPEFFYFCFICIFHLLQLDNEELTVLKRCQYNKAC